MPRTLGFIDEAIEEADAAARWYAERSPTAAAAFADEIDSATAEITGVPLAWPAYNHNTRRFLLRRFPYLVVYRVSESTTWSAMSGRLLKFSGGSVDILLTSAEVPRCSAE